MTLEHNLFGWLYNDGMDDLGAAIYPTSSVTVGD